MSDFNTAAPRITVEAVGDRFRATVHFPSGAFNARRPVIGPVLASPANAVAAALTLAVPVIVDIVTPVEYPDFD